MTASTLDATPLGTSSLSVSRLCLGANVFGWSVDEQTAHALLDAFVDGGGSFIDTANIYRGGTSERFIGSWLAAHPARRDDVVIATKVGMEMPDGTSGLGPAYVREACAASLERLGIDVIDVYYAHRPDPQTPLLESLRAFDALVREGIVRSYGLSNYDATQLREALTLCDRHELTRPLVLQPEHNVVDRDAFPAALQQLCVDEQIAVAPYYGLASGFLTGKYRRGEQPPQSVRAARVRERYDEPRAWDLLDGVLEIAQRHAATPAQVALAWLAAQPGITAPIASATSVTQLHELLGAFSVQLDEQDLARLDR